MARTGDVLVEHGGLSRRDVEREARRVIESSDKSLPPRRIGDYLAACVDSSRIGTLLDHLVQKTHPEANQHDLKSALKAVFNRRAILLVGAGFSLKKNDHGRVEGLTGEALRQWLFERLIQKLPHANDDIKAMAKGASLPRLAQWYERVSGKHDLKHCVSEACDELLPRTPAPHHACLARLDCFGFIVTTNWDRLIEQAFQRERPGKLNVVTDDQALRHLRIENRTLIKVHGDFRGYDFEEEPSLTEAHFIQRREDNPILYNLLQALFIANDIIIVGFRPDDYNFAYLQTVISKRARDRGQIYVVDPDRQAIDAAMTVEAKHIPLSAEDFFNYLEMFLNTGGGRVGLSSVPPGSAMGDTADTSMLKHWAPEQVRLAKQLRLLLKQRHVEVVAPMRDASASEQKAAAGHRAAHMLREWSREGDSICVGGGETVKHMIESINPDGVATDLRLYAASIRAFPGISSFGSTTILSLLVEKLKVRKATGNVFPIQPLLARHWMDLNLSSSDPLPFTVGTVMDQVHKYFDEAGKSRLIFFGVGSMDVESGGFAELCETCIAADEGNIRINEVTLAQYKRRLREMGFVGDILCRPVKGWQVNQCAVEQFLSLKDVEATLAAPDGEGWKQFIARLYFNCWALQPTAIREAARDPERQVVVLATGASKAEAIRAVCEGGLSSSLIVDQALAESIIKLIQG